jgi:hypothetical protein
MAANLRDFVLTNFEGKEVYNGLMQLSSKFSAFMPLLFSFHHLNLKNIVYHVYLEPIYQYFLFGIL